jgi:hypothetical protein
MRRPIRPCRNNRTARQVFLSDGALTALWLPLLTKLLPEQFLSASARMKKAPAVGPGLVAFHPPSTRNNDKRLRRFLILRPNGREIMACVAA